MKSTVAVLGVIASLSALPAAAQVNGQAFYGGVTIGQSTFKESCTGFAPGVSCDENDTALRVLGGYQFTPNFAAEIGYHDFGQTEASAGGARATIKANAWEPLGVGRLPVAPQLGLYGKLGAYAGEAKLDSNFGASATDTNTGLTFGGGLQWDVQRQLGLRVEWQRYRDLGGNNAGHGDIDVLSIGGIWRFR